jgi:callose synthase
VCLGLREHIYTGPLSTPSWFMAQQEQLFGTMWQRLMASPLRVRLHYGHPDLFDAVWINTRGGTSKGSTTINVSEDMFAGFTVALRGGESGHVNFLPVGKGRDVGILQIATFEAKISGGTAISGTTRDTFRAFASADIARLLSFFHTGLGFYIVRCGRTQATRAALRWRARRAPSPKHTHTHTTKQHHTHAQNLSPDHVRSTARPEV